MGKSTYNVRSGLALAFAASTISIFLYLQPDYFDLYTKYISILFAVIGIAGFGTELDKLICRKTDLLTDYQKGSGIFDNLGVGIAILVICFSLYTNITSIFINIIILPLLLISIYGIYLGLVNILFLVLLRESGQATHEKLGTTPPSTITKPWSWAVKIAVVIAGTVAFIASLLQILQILKVIP